MFLYKILLIEKICRTQSPLSKLFNRARDPSRVGQSSDFIRRAGVLNEIFCIRIQIFAEFSNLVVPEIVTKDVTDLKREKHPK